MERQIPPSRVVVRAPNWLGDAVMALPALAALRAALPAARIAIAAAPSVLPLFDEQTDAAPDERVVLTATTRESRALSAGGFDAALLLTNSFRTAWMAREAGIPDRWGYAANLRGWLLTRSVTRPSGRVHQAEYYSALVRGLGFPDTVSAPRLGVQEETRLRAAALLAQHGIGDSDTLVGFAPGAAYGHAKRWPPRRVAEVIARLTRERGAICVIVGTAADRDAEREIESSLPAGVRVIDLVGRTDLRVLAGVLARCRAFVSNDSGAMHLAAAIGIPVTAIFGPTDERVTAPIGQHDVLIHQVFCRPCMLRDCPIDHRCMKRISADTVYNAVASRLAERPAVSAEAQR